MGCGNSSPTNTNSSSNPAGPTEASSKVSEDSGPEDDKWKNYGGVYVGFPTDLSNIPQVQIGSLRGATEEFTYRERRKGSRCCPGPQHHLKRITQQLVEPIYSISVPLERASGGSEPPGLPGRGLLQTLLNSRLEKVPEHLGSHFIWPMAVQEQVLQRLATS